MVVTYAVMVSYVSRMLYRFSSLLEDKTKPSALDRIRTYAVHLAVAL